MSFVPRIPKKMPASKPSPARPTVGIVGAGRTRQGLGPYLASWLERAGAHVAGVSGRQLAGAEVAAVTLSEQLQHPVAAYPNARELACSVDALVVACPVPGHLNGLDAALAAGVPCLCEKPLVFVADTELGLERCARFAERELLLVENCQWPFVLGAFDELFPGHLERPAQTFEMRLSPAWPGPEMIADSLSHVLSLVQAVAALGPDAEVQNVTQSDASADAQSNTVRFDVVGGTENVAVALHLQCCPQQPRPAWFAIDGHRVDRKLGENYAISFVSEDGRTANVQDPLAQLVYGFVANLKANHRARKATQSERTDALDAIAVRLRLYRDVIGGL